MIKIRCPKCQRILGETDKSVEARINCRGCKNAVDIKIIMAKRADYLPEKSKDGKEKEK